ncbi:MAG: hypothetical protein CL670_00630 [Balneola sp.]|jgi:ferric-dicitrate binding protein FerR (iron transport regulator)|nr:hypothetical protein [Balneola sp.]MBE77638.1 hypothetical protein [Balneola sp.]HBX65746.1 hypothetical protein [Balneolaceae bacterium]|tara:strand:+ start:8245 stop:9207 length:963 start_codon:yes stop_codon:yes gene_type:complete
MADNNNISPANNDTELARLIGESLPDLSKLDQTQDPLLPHLFSYKETVTSQTVSINSEALWDSISGEMNNPAEKARVLQLSPAVKRYLMAAAVLIIALVGSFMYQSYLSPVLIGESFASAEVIELQDGSTVTLRPYSKLFEIDNTNASAMYKLEGEGYFEVTPNPDRIFSVQTVMAEVQVLGTKFVLSDWGSTSSVYLQEGRIRYTALSSNQAIELEPGESSSVTENVQSPQIQSVNEDVFTDWLNNELVFRNESVEQVFSELEQHYNIQIQTAPEVAGEFLSGTIGLDSLSTVLRDLELVLGGTFTQTGPNSYVFNPGE